MQYCKIVAEFFRSFDCVEKLLGDEEVEMEIGRGSEEGQSIIDLENRVVREIKAEQYEELIETCVKILETEINIFKLDSDSYLSQILKHNPKKFDLTLAQIELIVAKSLRSLFRRLLATSEENSLADHDEKHTTFPDTRALQQWPEAISPLFSVLYEANLSTVCLQLSMPTNARVTVSFDLIRSVIVVFFRPKSELAALTYADLYERVSSDIPYSFVFAKQEQDKNYRVKRSRNKNLGPNALFSQALLDEPLFNPEDIDQMKESISLTVNVIRIVPEIQGFHRYLDLVDIWHFKTATINGTTEDGSSSRTMYVACAIGFGDKLLNQCVVDLYETCFHVKPPEKHLEFMRSVDISFESASQSLLELALEGFGEENLVMMDPLPSKDLTSSDDIIKLCTDYSTKIANQSKLPDVLAVQCKGPEDSHLLPSRVQIGIADYELVAKDNWDIQIKSAPVGYRSLTSVKHSESDDNRCAVLVDGHRSDFGFYQRVHINTD